VPVQVRSRFPDGSTMDSLAVYLFDEWRPMRALTIGAGLRYSVFDIHLPDAADGQDVNLEPDDLTGDLHLSYQYSPSLQLVTNFGRGFRAPNIFDLGTLGARPGNRFNEANGDLDPESVVSLDVGIKLAGERWKAEAFVFYSDYDDKITSVATGETTVDGRTIVRSENANKVEIYGLETGARYRAADRWEFYGVVNYARGDETDSDGVENPADRMPPLNGKLGLVYTPRVDLTVEPFMLFAAEQDRLSLRDVDDPRIDPDGTAGWATFNLDLRWHAESGLDLGLRLENVLDKRYREHGSGLDAPGAGVNLWLSGRF
jgi:outer membrane receptor protein involved in Fe transport